MKKTLALFLALLMAISFSNVALAADDHHHDGVLGFLSEIFPFAVCQHNYISSYVGGPYEEIHNGQIHIHQTVLNRCTKCGEYYYSTACFGLA